MKKVLKILLVIFIIIALSITGMAVWQWKNIKSIVLGINKSPEEISQMRTDNQKQLINDLQSFMDEPLRPMTDEEKKQVEEGTLTVSEVYQTIFEERQKELEETRASENPVAVNPESNASGGNESSKKNVDNGSGVSPQGQETASENTETNSGNTTASGTSANSESKDTEVSAPKSKDEIVSGAMAKLYGLQNQYTATAEATIAQGAQYYESIKTHDGDADARAATISHYTPIVRSVESQCDADVEAVLSQLKTDLEGIGADTSIIASIRQTYAGEKQLKLSYYSSVYLN